MKSKINVIGIIGLAALLLGSCSGLKKMKKGAPEVKYTVTPEVLEDHAGKVNLTVKVKVPEKYMNKKATLELTPVLVYENGETAYPSKTVQGEKVDGNNQVISYANGGQYTYSGTVPYNKDMRISDLVVRIKGTKGAQEKMFDPITIAKGVVSTSELIQDEGAAVALGKDKFQRIIPINKEADIYFVIQQAILRKSQLTKDEISALKDFVKESKEAANKEFKGVEISAYASPDGPEKLNTRLSANREKNTKKYFSKVLKKNKVDTKAENFYDLKNTPEDWEGFKALMEKSDIKDKELILRVLSMYSDPEVREKEIKNITEAYKVIGEDILPKLRRSIITVKVDEIGKTDAEISQLAASEPTKLNVEELLYAATLTNDLDKKLSIYTSVTKQFPKCWRGFNDVAYVQAQKGELDAALDALKKAEELTPGNAVVKNNLGVVSLMKGDVAKAEEYFGQAAGVGPELNVNLAIVAMHKGDYEAAVRLFGNNASVNAALAKILAGDLNAASATLNAINEELAMKYYLKAVVAGVC